MRKIFSLCIALATALLLSLQGCGGGGSGIKGDEAFAPEKQLAQVDKLLDSKDYEEARKLLLEVKNRDTTKRYAPQAQLKIADSYIREKEPDLAIEEYKKFLELYPGNQYASYAQYQIAMAYFSQIESADRGSGAARKALQEFQRLKELYPRNPYREAVELRIEKARATIAEGEFITGEFYFKKDSYKAAIHRLEGLLKQFPEYKRADEALLLTGKAYRALKMEEKARDAFQRLITAYPSSKFVSEATRGIR